MEYNEYSFCPGKQYCPCKYKIGCIELLKLKLEDRMDKLQNNSIKEIQDAFIIIDEYNEKILRG